MPRENSFAEKEAKFSIEGGDVVRALSAYVWRHFGM